ncbi:inactive glucose-6-phosphate 1-dehydrogenase 4, chloroplastic-like isoform X4 [Triticum dicoccoides]|uniref:inactive glucose-6-phosphate 1-dehydrogenase 4, chloroplastic-like isoform X4 n=1 Tax=Triticum dicoccoides TaxID=85692 RepID=UPI0018909199|nr:inactive glucose-6-phosphate 1-dehydrogenase 4, chloroplastic-like isoform X4 [Triticum dicoccoides]
MATTVLAVRASAAPAPPSLGAARFSPVAGPAVSLRTQCWIAAKMKLHKALRRHGSQVQRKLEIQGVGKIPDCFKVASLTGRMTRRNVQLADETGGETANTSSVMSDNSIDDKSSMHLGLNHSEADHPVLEEDLVLFDNFDDQPESVPSLCIAVIGATGELARNKVFPALFALYYSDFLPQNVAIFGYSRKTLADEDLRSMIEANLTCRVDHHENCEEKLNEFLKRTYYVDAGHDNIDGMAKLNSKMAQIEGTCAANRIFYLAVPQEALLDVALPLSDSAQTKHGWNRIIIEKPFGFTSLSSQRVTQSLLSRFEERQIYRIDHLLGKDLIENLTVLRFSNLVFEPLWSRKYIRNVQVVFSEETSAETQGRYFGNYGIIRDIVHSHILQTIALFAMEPPVSLDGEDIRDEKVKVLKSIRKVDIEDVVLGQLKDTSGKVDRYTKSMTPTYFAAAMYIDNARWDGVPFLIKTGMGLMENRAEIRIQFHHVPGNIYRERFGHDIDLDTNELILRDLPEEAILLKVNNKVPGLGLQLDASELNLLYRDRYGGHFDHLVIYSIQESWY